MGAIGHIEDHKQIQTDNERSAQAADFLRALANPHRLMILWLLHKKKYTVMELCEHLQLRQSLVSQHLARLRLDGVVSAERQGHYVIYSLRDDKARAILEILSGFMSKDTGMAAPRPYNGDAALTGRRTPGSRSQR